MSARGSGDVGPVRRVRDPGDAAPVRRVPDPAGPVRLEAEVRAVRKAGPIRTLSLSAPELARRTAPGQFLTVGIPGAVIRRPFWIASSSGREVRIVFYVAGPATSWLAARPEGSVLDVLGPLGRGFPLPEQPATCLLAGEGPAAALRQLAVALRARGCRVEVLLSARSGPRLAEAHLDDAPSALLRPSTVIVTRDGSHAVTRDGSHAHTRPARRGDIPTVIDEVLDRVRPSVVYTAGRPDVMQAVSAAATRRHVPCAVALQRLMACGIGVCWTCVVPVRRPDGTAIVRACLDGPVMDGAQVVWETLDDPAAALLAEDVS